MAIGSILAVGLRPAPTTESHLRNVLQGLQGVLELAEGGDTTPPTKLQTFFFGIRIARVWIDPKHDIDVISGHLHPLDQRPDEVAFARPVSLG